MNTSMQRAMTVLAGYFSYFLLLSLWVGLNWGGIWYAAGFVFLVGVVPFLDMISTKDYLAFRLSEFSETQKFLLRIAPMGYLLGYIAFVLAYAARAPLMSGGELFFSILSLGAAASIMITAAHELIHKNKSLNKWLARLGLLFVGYMHFEISHLVGHHRDAATELDNHTAWYNENLYRYLVRTSRDALAFCWQYERQRTQKRQGRVWSFQNRMIWFGALPLFVGVLFGIFLGREALILWIGQALFGIFSLETVAYIEHYGLMRSQALDGRYLPIRDAHSWNSYHRFSNYLSFMLQRHADHHTNASKDFFCLSVSQEAMELPFGYPVLIGIASVPPLWMSLMNPPLQKHPEVITHSSSKTYNFPSNRKATFPRQDLSQ